MSELQKYKQMLEQLKLGDGEILVDDQLRYVHFSENARNTEGIGDSKVDGLNLRDTDCYSAKFADLYFNVMKQFIVSPNNSADAVTSVLNNDQQMNFYKIKYNKILENGKLAGVLLIANSITPAKYVSTVGMPIKNKPLYLLTDKNNPKDIDGLNPKEIMIAQLLFMGKTHKEIAYIMSKILNIEIPKNTITTIINRKLYTKYDVSSNSALLTKLHKTDILDITHEKLLENL